MSQEALSLLSYLSRLYLIFRICDVLLLLLLLLVKCTVTYGAETWKFNKNLESKLMLMEMDILRRSARYSRLEKIRNNFIREKMNITNSVLDYIRYK